MKKFNCKWFYLLMFLPLLFSCNESDTWINHYEQTAQERTDLRLADFINSQEDLSKFYQMLQISGYDTLLNASQSFTVWAPLNSVLEGIDMGNKDKVTEIVRNHIARFAISSSGIESKRVFMIDAKFINFSKSTGGLTFGNETVIRADILANNGIIHIIDGYVPYINNIWEHITSADGLDSLSNYMKSKTKLVFDPISSTVITYNDDGSPIYDSAFINSNEVLNVIGELDNEDSLYTVLLPDNQAWNSSYNYMEGFYKVLPDEGGVAQQKKYIRNNIVQNMVFREKVIVPSEYDSLITTTGNVFHDPAAIFEGASFTELSNGWAYITDSLKYKPTETFLKEIRVEAENPDTRTLYQSTVSQRSSAGTGFDLSGDKYILVNPSTARNITGVIFKIPNTLSAKYKIYVVFAPLAVTGSADTTVSNLAYALYYNDINKAGTKGEQKFINIADPDFVTDPHGVTKMYVTDFEFPYSNIIDLEDKETVENNTTVTLWVVNMNTKETTKLTRRMCIDCIILEPVLE
ncbi:fasciclin domain-containing protein [Saccharicrinis sp. FJH54]|uniref:fasciclin domain-containing protein n=1 Tax=Saccharicrinis sp. FJH54 TaxID=3344665 RepID=UPI0035D47258